MKRISLVLLSVAIAACAVALAAFYRYTHPIVVTTQPTTKPATQLTAAPATSRRVAASKTERGPATQLLDIIRANDPKYPATQRLDAAIDLRYAARLVLSDPVYLDGQGNLWITRADAPATFDFLKAGSGDTATQVTRDTVVFALWTPTENNLWLPHLIVKSAGGSSGYELVDYDGRRALPDIGFQWERALVLYGPRGSKARIVVPTTGGACAFAFDDAPDAIVKSHQRLIPDRQVGASAVQLAMDVGGVIAYVTNAAGTKGGSGVARFAQKSGAKDAPAEATEYEWTKLTGAAGWPDHIVHLVPLLDGSVLQVVSADEQEKDKVTFSLNAVATVPIDRKRVLALIDQLSHSDSEKREDAFKQLTTYGPGITPLLDSSLEDASPEAQIRIRQLLKNKIEPKLSNLTLTDGRMRVVNRLPDGGVIFYAEGGVQIPRADDTPEYVTPAWLCVRPGRAVSLLRNELVADLSPDKHKIVAWGLDETIVIDPVLGPRVFVGKQLDPMLAKRHQQFNEFAGIDMTGRWVFRGPPTLRDIAPHVSDLILTQTTPAPTFTAPATNTARDPSTNQVVDATTTFSKADVISYGPRQTLIIDPRLPDPTPRLPGWELPGSAGKAGWDKDNWPVICMDVKPNPIPWALGESDWRVVDEKVEKVFNEPKDVPAAVTTAPTTRAAATTRASTTMISTPADTRPVATTQDADATPADALLVAPGGDVYQDGRQAMRVTRADGTVVNWPLPVEAVGSAVKPTLLRTRDNLLFLFNEPGRIVRMRPTPDGDQPFAVEGVFTRRVPTDADPIRIWLDPADRICIAHGVSRVVVFFPIGRIPPDIAAKMRPEDFPPEDQ